MAWPPAGPALFRPLPLRRPPGRLPARLRRQLLLRRRRGRVPAVHPQAALQFRDPQLQPPDQLSLPPCPQRRAKRGDLGVPGLDHLPQPGRWPHATRPAHPGTQRAHQAQAAIDHNMRHVIKPTRPADPHHGHAAPSLHVNQAREWTPRTSPHKRRASPAQAPSEHPTSTRKTAQ